MPTKTPVRVPASRAGAMPGVLERLPRHLEQQALLRIHAAASRGAIPKNCGSKPSTSRRNPPRRVDIFPGALGSGS